MMSKNQAGSEYRRDSRKVKSRGIISAYQKVQKELDQIYAASAKNAPDSGDAAAVVFPYF